LMSHQRFICQHISFSFFYSVTLRRHQINNNA
jgi:hypothetical protein